MLLRVLLLAIVSVQVAFGAALPELTFFIGSVEIKAAGDSVWEAAMFGQELQPATQLKTYAESRAELVFADGSVIRVDEKSLYQLPDADAKGKNKGAFLAVGKVWSNIQKMSATRDEFKINTPTAIAAVRGTIYGMEMGEDSTATVKVYEGEVEVSNPPPAPTKPKKELKTGFGGPTKTLGPQRIAPPRKISMTQWVEVIKAQQQIVISRNGTKSVTEFDLAQESKDAWVAFNQKRDKEVDRSGNATDTIPQTPQAVPEKDTK